MLRQNNTLHIISICSILTFYWAASKSCSSFKASDILSIEEHGIFTTECDLTSQELFFMEFPLSLRQMTQIYITLVHSEENISMRLTPSLRLDSYNFEVISTNKQEFLAVNVSCQSLRFEINNQTALITFQDSILQYSRSMRTDSSYKLSIQLNNNFTQQSPARNSKTSFRYLYQCPEDFMISNGKCERVCPPKQFNNFGICSRCSEKCVTGRCLSEKTCNPCQGNQIFYAEKNTCVEQCPPGFFEDPNNKVCAKCSQECVSCNFPYGLCSASYFKTDIIINFIIATGVTIIITVCVCCCSKEKPSSRTLVQQGQQLEEAREQQANNDEAEEPDQSGLDSYTVFTEDVDLQALNEEMHAAFSERRPRNRLTEHARVKLLAISMHNGEFMIDDANDEEAISHQSSNKIVCSKLTVTPKTSPRILKSLKHSQVIQHVNEMGSLDINSERVSTSKLDTLEEAISIQIIFHSQRRQEEIPRDAQKETTDSKSWLYFTGISPSVEPHEHNQTQTTKHEVNESQETGQDEKDNEGYISGSSSNASNNR